MNYKEANALLSGRNKDSKKIDNNTYLIRLDNGDIAVKLHNTNVVTYKPDGSVILDSGGWQTNTTKDRMNRYLPFGRISQSKKIWYFQHGEVLITYKDGCGINAKGKLFGGQSEAATKKTLKLIEDVKKYAKRFIIELEKGKIGRPSSGDCWYCAMQTEDGKTLGDSTKDNEHILSHIKTNYFVPSLLFNACKERGISRIAEHNLAVMTSGQTVEATQMWDVVKGQVETALIKYISTRLGLTI